jgi:hypothetical protein
MAAGVDDVFATAVSARAAFLDAVTTAKPTGARRKVHSGPLPGRLSRYRRRMLTAQTTRSDASSGADVDTNALSPVHDVGTATSLRCFPGAGPMRSSGSITASGRRLIRSAAVPCAVVAALVLLSSSSATAAAVDVPAVLQPWVPWVLHGHEAARCPQSSATNTRTCEWPGPLVLDVNEKAGTFEQRWSVLVPARVRLPGSADRWPQAVTVDGKRAVVLDDGGPTIELAAGEHVVAGRFAWDAQPEKVSIPPSTALLSLRVRGREVLFPRREGSDVYVDREQEQGGAREADSLDVAVFRKVTDDLPLLVETRLVLDVAGKAREVVVPQALLDGFEPSFVAGPVPVRVEGTRLRAQVRPGSHTITVIGRSVRPDAPLLAPPAFDDGPPEEIWVYEARPSLRIAHVEGVASVAADQTRLPAEWRSLPAWRLLPGEQMKLVQDRRGDVDTTPSQLTLERTLWLDFDGGGFTAHDKVRGPFRGDRLEMGPSTTLGHAVVSGKDAFITSLSGGAPGVEVRSRSVDVVADSRIVGRGDLPAVSWAHDFERARISLHLPPGYSVVSASGVDDVSDAWVKRWSLYEIFLVVVLSAAILRLWGPLFAAIAACGFTLSFQETGAPVVGWVLVVILAGIHHALAAALPAHARHAAMRGLGALRIVVAVVVALQTLSFSIGQVRVGMYPVLAQPWQRVGDGAPAHNLDARKGDNANFAQAEVMPSAAMAPPPPPAPPGEIDDEGGIDLGQLAGRSLATGGGNQAYEQRPTKKALKQMAMVDPDAVLQTGPGLPRWAFSSVQLSFSGPVRADQTISLWLLSPTQNLLLALLRVALLALLVLAALGFPGHRWPAVLVGPFRKAGALWANVLVVVIVVVGAGGTAHAQVPDAAALDELRTRLLAPPPCGDACLEVASMSGEATPQSLRLSFEVHAGADVVFPVPADDGQWTPRQVLVDGRAGDVVRTAQGVVVRVVSGVHDVVLEGPLPQRPTVQIALPRPPRRGALRAVGWTVDGLHDDGAVDGNLQLSRIVDDSSEQNPEKAAELPPSVLPPFLLVERTVQLGLVFEVETRVVRLSPTGTPIVVDVPLLPGESVTTDGVRAETKDGRGVVKVNLGPTDSETSWHSTLAQASTLSLQAPRDVPWLESWVVQESPLWHVTKDGIPSIHDADDAQRATTTWRPWPGEALTLTLVRPSGIAGQTLTIDAVSVSSTPGLRSTDVRLALDVRTSRGAQHPIRLPAGGELIASTLSGKATPLRADNGVVVVPLSPGAQRVELSVRLSDGVGFSTKAPVFDVGGEAVNIETLLKLPEDRWVLFCAGPRTGPAVLFWSFLVVIVVVATGLGRVPSSPLRVHEWVLLSLGMTQVNLAIAAFVAGWLLILGARREARFSEPGRIHNALFDLFQAVVVFSTFVGLVGLVDAIQGGLLGAPDMQVTGNGSSGNELRWFSDRSDASTPEATAWSVPLWTYRAVMLAWSLWLVRALLRWLRDGFAAFGAGGFFRDPFPAAPATRASATSATTSATSAASAAAPTSAAPSTLVVPEAPAGAPTSAAAVSNTVAAPPSTSMPETSAPPTTPSSAADVSAEAPTSTTSTTSTTTETTAETTAKDERAG